MTTHKNLIRIILFFNLKGETMKTRLFLAAVVGLFAFGAVHAQEKGAFGSTTIDLGVVVTDIEKSAKFYKDAIGFKEVKGFGVPADFAGDAGLTSKKPLDIRVFVLGEGDTATKIKLMQVEGVNPRKSDNQFIHSQTGFRYLTIIVNDTNAAMERLKKAGVKPIAKTPILIPPSIVKDTYLTIVQDPDGNLVELVGPKK